MIIALAVVALLPREASADPVGVELAGSAKKGLRCSLEIVEERPAH